MGRRTGNLKEYSRERKENRFSRVPYWQRWSPDSNYMVYAYKHNVYIQEKGDTTSYQLTTDGERYYSYSFQLLNIISKLSAHSSNLSI